MADLQEECICRKSLEWQLMQWEATTRRAEIVKGAIEAVNTRRDIQVVLVGQQEVIAEELKKYTYEKDQIEIKNCNRSN